MAIPASSTELYEAFFRLNQALSTADIHTAAEFDQTCRYLLRVYAIECGLKLSYFQFVLRRSDLTTVIPRGYFGNDGHDLKTGIENLVRDQRLRPDDDLSKLAQQAPQNIKLQSKPEPLYVSRVIDYHSREAHQAWRYGIPLNVDDEAGLANWHAQILVWLNANRRQLQP